VELAKIRIRISRDELKSGVYKPEKEHLEGKINLPVEDVILGILDRLIKEKRGQMDGD
jgi:hypothetical protein